MAEDAVQETFIKAYQAMATFRGDSSEKTWLLRGSEISIKEIEAI